MSKFNANTIDKKQVYAQANQQANSKQPTDGPFQKRLQHIQEREARRKKLNLKREKFEMKKRGDYDILYPYVSHHEEDFAIQKLALYHAQNRNRDVQQI